MYFALLGFTTAVIYTRLIYFLFLPDLLHVLFSKTLDMTLVSWSSAMTLTFNLSVQFNFKITRNPPWYLEGGVSKAYPGTKGKIGHRVQLKRSEKEVPK